MMSEINVEDMYKKIKKQNGEAVAKVLRSEVLLDIPNLCHILEFAGNDPEKIKALAPVIREIYKTQNTSEYQTNKNPLELLNDAGYDAFVVTSEKQKNSIKKYYRTGEEICTFRDPHRHEKYYMIHAVKRGADHIKPSDHPEREDEYGTSVISIQIAKTGGFISIKNRYNHTVNNPDATFNNNPDNIICGLSNSLRKYFNVEFNTTKNPLPDDYRMVNDQLVYFNHEIDNTYFGPDYYFSGSTITKLNTSYEVMLDCFILDTRTGEVKDVVGIKGATHKMLQSLLKDKKISVRTNPNRKQERMIFADDTHVLSFEKGSITELNLPDTKRIEDSFLLHNKNLRKLYVPKLEYVGNEFLPANEGLTELDLPSLKEVGYRFLSFNKSISKFNAPRLEKTASCFLMENMNLTELVLPCLIEIGDHSMDTNTILSSFFAPKLERIGPLFLMQNLALKELDLPLVKEIGGGFLRDNKILETFYAPALEKIGDHVMVANLGLTDLSLPSLKEVGDNFLLNNKKLHTLYAPKLEKAKHGFLANNTKLTNVYVASDEIIHNKHNKRLSFILAKNNIKKKIKKPVNSLISLLVTKHNTKH